MAKHKGFEDFLQDVHGRQYVGVDDDMPDDFDMWLVDMDVDEWIRLGDAYANTIRSNQHGHHS